MLLYLKKILEVFVGGLTPEISVLVPESLRVDYGGDFW
jgi:hypothetical protein